MSDVELELRKLIAAYDLVLDDVSTQRAAADAIDPIRRRLRAQGIRPVEADSNHTLGLVGL